MTGVHHSLLPDFTNPLLTYREDATLYREAIMAHAAIGTVFKDIPVVLTSSAENGLSSRYIEQVKSQID